MKIVILELMPYPYTLGGGTTHITNLAQALINKGHEVHIVTSKKNSEKLVKPPEQAIIHNVGLPHKKFGVHKGILKLYEYIYRLFYESAFVISATKKLKELKPDIIDAQSMGITAVPAARSKLPFIVTAHWVFHLGIKELYSRKNKKFISNYMSKIYHLISDYNLKKTSAIVSQADVTTNHYKERANKILKKKPLFKVIPNLIDINKFRPGNKKKKNQLICICRFTKQKAVDKLVTAMEELKDYTLLLVGDGELRDEIEQIATPLKNVKLLGILPPEKYIPLVQESEFFVMTPEWEGLPYVVIEAMSMGTVPIVTNVGNLPGLVIDNKNGFFFKSNNPEDIVKKIKEVSKLNIKKYSENARKTIVENYSLDYVAKLFISTYNKAIKDV